MPASLPNLGRLGLGAPTGPSARVPEGDEIVCSITLDALEPGAEEWQLPCGHWFKTTQIGEWVATKKERATCPVCRDPIPRPEREDVLRAAIRLKVSEEARNLDSPLFKGTVDFLRTPRVAAGPWASTLVNALVLPLLNRPVFAEGPYFFFAQRPVVAVASARLLDAPARPLPGADAGITYVLRRTHQHNLVERAVRRLHDWCARAVRDHRENGQTPTRAFGHFRELTVLSWKDCVDTYEDCAFAIAHIARTWGPGRDEQNASRDEMDLYMNVFSMLARAAVDMLRLIFDDSVYARLADECDTHLKGMLDKLIIARDWMWANGRPRSSYSSRLNDSVDSVSYNGNALHTAINAQLRTVRELDARLEGDERVEMMHMNHATLEFLHEFKVRLVATNLSIMAIMEFNDFFGKHIHKFEALYNSCFAAPLAAARAAAGAESRSGRPLPLDYAVSGGLEIHGASFAVGLDSAYVKAHEEGSGVAMGRYISMLDEDEPRAFEAAKEVATIALCAKLVCYMEPKRWFAPSPVTPTTWEDGSTMRRSDELLRALLDQMEKRGFALTAIVSRINTYEAEASTNVAAFGIRTFGDRVRERASFWKQLGWVLEACSLAIASEGSDDDHYTTIRDRMPEIRRKRRQVLVTIAEAIYEHPGLATNIQGVARDWLVDDKGLVFGDFAQIVKDATHYPKPLLGEWVPIEHVEAIRETRRRMNELRDAFEAAGRVAPLY